MKQKSSGRPEKSFTSTELDGRSLTQIMTGIMLFVNFLTIFVQ